MTWSHSCAGFAPRALTCTCRDAARTHHHIPETSVCAYRVAAAWTCGRVGHALPDTSSHTALARRRTQSALHDTVSRCDRTASTLRTEIYPTNQCHKGSSESDTRSPCVHNAHISCTTQVGQLCAGRHGGDARTVHISSKAFYREAHR